MGAYCGLCDGAHHPRDCATTRVILVSETAAERATAQ